MPISKQFLTAVTLSGGMLLSCLLAAAVSALEKPYRGPFVENDDMLFVLMPRTPAQMAAFYEARGFPQNAIERITGSCFVTAHIENRSNRVIWLETAHWKLSSNGHPLQRLGANYWQQQWDETGLSAASRATFGWTQLPEVRDLQPHEPVGGNIVLPGSTRDFDLEARFFTGQDKRGRMLEVRFENVTCPKETPEP